MNALIGLIKGDLEREMGLEISPLCDRKTISIPQSQIGFISYIIEPTFALLTGNYSDLINQRFSRERKSDLNLPYFMSDLIANVHFQS